MQRYILFLFLFLIFVTHAQKAQNAINSFAKDPVLKSGSLSFLAIDLDSGTTVASYSQNNALISASLTKLFSTTTAFEVLGENYSPNTRIYADGPIDDKGILHGNLWIRGAGDVSLGSKYFNAAGHEFDFLIQWTDTLISLGIKGIDGSIIADGSEFGYNGAPKGWSSNDLGNYYGATHAGICLYDNTIKLIFDSGKIGSKAKLTSVYPKVDNLVMTCNVVAGSSKGDDCNVFGSPFSLNRKATGEIPANRKGFEVKGSMPDPECQLAKEWLKILKQKGIVVSNGAKFYRLLSPKLVNNYSDNFKLLFSHAGRSVKEIAYWTNLKSVNLFAEGLLDYLGYAKLGDGSSAASLGILKKYWTGKLSLEALIINDGSGLSRANAISARHFCDLLRYMYTSPNYLNFRATLPIAGLSGTIKSLCKGQLGEGRVMAKSGTLNNVKGYAGYVETISGKKIAFSFCVNDFSCTSSQLVSKMEAVLNALVEY